MSSSGYATEELSPLNIQSERVSPLPRILTLPTEFGGNLPPEDGMRLSGPFMVDRFIDRFISARERVFRRGAGEYGLERNLKRITLLAR
jgi:hypothetical protein